VELWGLPLGMVAMGTQILGRCHSAKRPNGAGASAMVKTA
jgi:hypothetical protein